MQPAKGAEGQPVTFQDACAAADQYYQALGEVAETKRAAALKAMAGNPTWPGLLLKMSEQPPAQPLNVGLAADFTEEAGSEPFLLASRRGCWRFGPGILPLTGVGHVLVGASEGLYVLTFDVTKLLSNGISLKDLHSFLETSTGHDFIDAGVHIVHLPPRAVLYVPAGHAATLLVASSLDAQAPEVGFAWATRCCVRARVSALPDATKAALSTFHEEHAGRAEPRKLWTQLSLLFKKCVS